MAVVGVMSVLAPFVFVDDKDGNANFEGAWILMLLGCLRLIFFRVKSWWVDRMGCLGLEGREVTQEAYGGEEEAVIDGVVEKNEVTAGVVAPGVDGALSMVGSVMGVSTWVGDATTCGAKEKYVSVESEHMDAKVRRRNGRGRRRRRRGKNAKSRPKSQC